MKKIAEFRVFVGYREINIYMDEEPGKKFNTYLKDLFIQDKIRSFMYITQEIKNYEVSVKLIEERMEELK